MNFILEKGVIMLNRTALREAIYYMCDNFFPKFDVQTPHDQEAIVDYWCLMFEDKYNSAVNVQNECTFQELFDKFLEYNKSVTNELGEALKTAKPLKGVIVYKDSNFKTTDGEAYDLPKDLRSFLVQSFQPYFYNIEGEELEGTVLTSGFFTIYPTKLNNGWEIEKCYILEE